VRVSVQFPEAFPDFKPDKIPRVEAWHGAVGAILVFLDPHIWERELQLLCDVLRSDGRLGSLVAEQVVPIYLSCPDFECAQLQRLLGGEA
jgi:hypothetical protein